jgi:hypothetical protein
MLKKVFAVLMCGVMLLSASLSVGASAPEQTTPVLEDVQPRLNYISSATSNLSFSGHMATCTAELKGIAGKTTAVWITMKLQKKTLWWWSDVNSWIKYFDTKDARYSLVYPVDGGGTYRLVSEFTAKSGSAEETITVTSAEKTIS